MEHSMRIFGIDIGGTKCTVAEATLAGDVLASVTFPTEAPASAVPRICRELEALHPGDSPVFGIACGDPQDSVRGIIQAPPCLPEWQDVAIVDALVDRFGGRAFLMNDANAGALAEWQFGAARGCSNVVFLTAGTGMGAGLILAGRLYEGATGCAGEVGHIRLAADGPVGVHKAGSFEGFCSGSGITQLAQARARELRGAVSFSPGSIDAITARHVGEAAERGDAVACEILAESGRRLGMALSIIIDILNPDVIVVGSMFVRCRRFLEPEMKRVLAQETLPRSLAACRIVPAALGDRLGPLQAVAVAVYRGGFTSQASKR